MLCINTSQMEAINSSDTYLRFVQYCRFDLYPSSLHSVNTHWNYAFNIYLESSNL